MLFDILMLVNILHASPQSVCSLTFGCLSAFSMLPYSQYAARHFDDCQHPPWFPTVSMLPDILMLVNILHASLHSPTLYKLPTPSLLYRPCSLYRPCISTPLMLPTLTMILYIDYDPVYRP
ncbi:hypothetical protein PoB_006423900 [Plakobranchus ocellatus]|uniref:G-protein coupled receptors family 1 profile domain-containing protein n=1 Tax=Plakobranchus ocellatus TaxID=259542 RepID=A0AAV4D0K4_9GAST|nr:hypothetical protein PoB_006423900 [Plakobranchus ocellatus]